MYDSIAQIVTHRIIIALTFLIAFAYMFFVSPLRSHLSSSLKSYLLHFDYYIRRCGWIVPFLLIPVFIYDKKICEMENYITLGVLFGIGLKLLINFKDKYFSGYNLNWVLSIPILIYIFLLMVPGFLQPPDLSNRSQTDLTLIEMHYRLFFGSGDRLASGLALFQEVYPRYGLIQPLFFSIVEKKFVNLSFGNYYNIIQISQVIFCIMAFIGYWMWNRKNILHTMISMMLLVPWIYCTHQATLYPNQSALRFIGFPIMILFLYWMREKTLKIAIVFLGFCASFLILLNPETGIAVSAGYFVFLISRLNNKNMPDILKLSALYFLCILIFFAIFVFVTYSTIQILPIPSDFNKFSKYLYFFSKGYGGLKLQLSEPIAWVIIVHSIYLIIYFGVKFSNNKMSIENSFKYALATTILVWFSYYVNRPAKWNLWSILFLYGFFLPEYIDKRVLKLSFSRRKKRLSISDNRFYHTMAISKTMVFTFIIIPFILVQNINAFVNVKNRVKFCTFSTIPGKNVSGALLSDGIALAIEDKARYLADIHTVNNTIYFTANSFFIPKLTGMNPRLPVSEVFLETINQNDLEELIKYIKDRDPRFLCFDDPNGAFHGDAYVMRLYERVKTPLASYYKSPVNLNGWQVYEKK